MEKITAYVLLQSRNDETPEIAGVTTDKEVAHSWNNLNKHINKYIYENIVYGVTYFPVWAYGRVISEKTYDSFPAVFTTENIRKYAAKKLAEIEPEKRWYEITHLY